MSSKTLLLALVVILAARPSTQDPVFQVVKMGTSVAPAVAKSVPGFSAIDCAMKCAETTGCFGFNWLQNLCGLFNISSYENAWTFCNNCDAFILPMPQKKRAANCTQSFTYYNSNYLSGCESAIDGNRSQLTALCSITQNGPNEWWEVELVNATLIKYVTIYNRQQCCQEWLNKFSVQVDGVECNRVNLTMPFSVANFSCNVAFGSRVR
uniref:F5/8 type C domain-containing protein n=1 Tax=Macrostomum lignano TaxID=282301 RepID=A0A1I8G6K3_9PLAT